MQGRAEKWWVREKTEIGEITALFASILCFHNQCVSHHLHRIHKKKEKQSVLFFEAAALLTRHPHTSHILSCS